MFDLKNPAKIDRTPVSRGLAESSERVSRKGGQYGAGLVRGVSVITRGEALGHRMWIDRTFLEQVQTAILSAGEKGTKSRFTHPSLSGDGMGKMTGRVTGASLQGDRVVGDLHILEAAHASPHGDLGGYVMDLAEEDPEGYGASIAFQHDEEAEEKFILDNGGQYAVNDEGMRYLSRKSFKSPDPLNVNNYMHARLKRLRAVDIVDSPAANPAGLFHRGPFELLESGEELLDYVLGGSERVPDQDLGIDATRLRGFVQRWADQRGVRFSKGDVMSVESDQKDKSGETQKHPTREELRAELFAEQKRFTDLFGAENGQKWFQEGVAFEAAKDRHIAHLAEQNRVLQQQLEAAKAGLGEREPVSGGADPNEEYPGERMGLKGDKFHQALGKNLGTFAASMKLPRS